MRLLRDPFVQFLAAGALIFLIYSFSNSADRAGARDRIVIDAPTQDWIYNNFAKQFRRSPTRDEMDALVRAHIEHEVKYREALALGLADGDSIVRRRMMQKFDFLFGHGAADLVPDDTVLQEWHESNADEFSEPARISFTHIWFSPDKRGGAADADARAALEALAQDSEDGQVVGDRFPLNVEFSQAPSEAVRGVLGPEFTEAVFRGPQGEWFGPLRSGLGIHLVHITEVSERSLIPFAEVREAVLEHWRGAESKRILAETLATLKSDYEIEIDEPALERFEYMPGD